MVLGCFLLSLFKYVGLFCLVLCFVLSFGFEFSVGTGGFCHRTGSDLLVFLFKVGRD